MDRIAPKPENPTRVKQRTAREPDDNPIAISTRFRNTKRNALQQIAVKHSEAAFQHSYPLEGAPSGMSCMLASPQNPGRSFSIPAWITVL